MRLFAASDPLQLVEARCSTLFWLHHRVVTRVSAPGAMFIPRLPWRLTLTPSKKFSRSLSVTADPPVFRSTCSYCQVCGSEQFGIGCPKYGAGFGVIVTSIRPGPLGAGA